MRLSGRQRICWVVFDRNAADAVLLQEQIECDRADTDATLAEEVTAGGGF